MVEASWILEMITDRSKHTTASKIFIPKGRKMSKEVKICDLRQRQWGWPKGKTLPNIFMKQLQCNTCFFQVEAEIRGWPRGRRRSYSSHIVARFEDAQSAADSARVRPDCFAYVYLWVGYLDWITLPVNKIWAYCHWLGGPCQNNPGGVPGSQQNPGRSQDNQ